MDYEIDFLSLFEDFEEKLEAAKQNLPYHFNVIDELYINENANTRILMKLLQFKKGRKFPILNSFVELFSKFLDKPIEIKNPNLYTGLDFIDGLIEDVGSYAIIIENKIYNAADQQSQIERYIKSVELHGFKHENIFVIYLTKDGSKEVSELSFTPIAKKKLQYTDLDKSGRYIQLNYKQHILPWLQDEIMPIFANEEFLSSGIFQYIDYLEGLFYIRKTERIMKEKINEYLETRLSLKENTASENFQNLTKKIEDADKLIETLRELQDSYVNKMCSENLLPDLKKFSKKYGFEIDSVTFQYSYIDITLTHSMWKKCSLVFINDNQNNYFGLCYNDIDKPIAKGTIAALAFENSKSSPWWPVWKYATNNFRYLNEDFWLSVSRGDFSKYLVDEFKKINDIVTKGNLKV